MTTNQPWDVIVVGAGNAALCAALSAAEQGAKVLVLEKATTEDRGGNSTFTVSVDTALVSPFSATTCSTYSPVAENVAVVVAAFALAKTTVPGPDTLRHVVFTAGPVATGV